MAQLADTLDVDRKASSVGEKIAGKYLTFVLGDEEYGIEILKVQEIIRMQKITKIPKAPDYVRGVINLRGKVIPIVELRVKFSMERQDDTEKTCIIVIRIVSGSTQITMGIIIDAVKEVLDIAPEQIEEAPSFGVSIDTDFILGIGKVGQGVKMLLEIDKVLSASDIESVAELSKK